MLSYLLVVELRRTQIVIHALLKCQQENLYHEQYFFFSSRRRHTRWPRDWSSHVCSSDLHETHWQNGALSHLALLFLEQKELLIDSAADRDDHAPAFFELLRQRLRDFVWRARHDDGVEHRDLDRKSVV